MKRIARAALVFLPAIAGAGACALDARGTAGAQAAGGAGAGGGSGGAGGRTGAGGGPIAPCGTYTPGDRLDVCTATYLGGPDDDGAGAVEIAPDGAILVGGTLTGGDFGLVPSTPSTPGKGALLRLSPDGKTPLAITRLGNRVSDLEVDRSSGEIVAVGDFGVISLDPEGKTARWAGMAGGVDARVSVGADGTAAVLSANEVTVYGAQGALFSSFLVDGEAADLTVEGVSKRVIVTGYRVESGSCPSHNVAFVKAYDYAGHPRWQSYGWSTTDGLCADTEGRRIAIGRDGKLYFAGETSKADNIFRRRPTDFNAVAPNVEVDTYTDVLTLENDAAVYFARLTLAGEIDLGQFLITRLGSDPTQSNAVRPRAITADESGNVFVGGESNCCIARRDTLEISGQKLGAYGGTGEGFVLIVSPDFTTRLTWTAWTGTGGSEDTWGIAVGRGVAAMVTTQVDSSAGSLLTVEPLQAAPAGGTEAFLSVWPAPAPLSP